MDYRPIADSDEEMWGEKKEKSPEKCDEAWDTDYPCDLPKGHKGEHKNNYARK